MTATAPTQRNPEPRRSADRRLLDEMKALTPVRWRVTFQTRDGRISHVYAWGMESSDFTDLPGVVRCEIVQRGWTE